MLQPCRIIFPSSLKGGAVELKWGAVALKGKALELKGGAVELRGGCRVAALPNYLSELVFDCGTILVGFCVILVRQGLPSTRPLLSSS